MDTFDPNDASSRPSVSIPRQERPPQLLGALQGLVRLLVDVSKESGDSNRMVAYVKIFLLLIRVLINLSQRSQK